MKKLKNLKNNFVNQFTSINTRKSYSRDIDDFLSKGLSLTEDSLILYRDSLIADQASSKTVARKLSAVKSFCRYLYRKGFTDKDISAFIRIPKAHSVKPTEALTDREVAKILKMKKPLRDQLIITLLATTGLRRSEIANLKKDQIMNYKGTTVIRSEGKGGKLREIPIPKNIDVDFKKHMLASVGETVFGISDSQVYRIVKKYVKKAGINKQASPHSFRSTMITKALESGIPISEVAEFVGHSSINTTQSYFRLRNGIEDSLIYKIKY